MYKRPRVSTFHVQLYGKGSIFTPEKSVSGSDRTPALLGLSQNGYGGLVRRLLSGIGILTFSLEGFHIHTRKVAGSF